MTKHRAIEIQISARVHAPKNGRVITEDIVRDAIRHKANTGRDVPGIDLKIIRWNHGGKTHRAKNTAEEWSRFARFLPGASILVYPFRQIRSR